MKKAFILSAIIFLITTLYAQQTGEVVYKTLGLSFTIPAGWIGQEMEEAFLIGHESKPGFVLLSTHHHRSIDQIKQEASQGIQDGQGTNLQMAGSFETVGKQGVGAAFGGYLEGQPVNAYIIGLINPQGGTGVTIMAATTPQAYDASYAQLAGQVAGSVAFFKAEIPPIVSEWKETLQNCRLTYMDSYFSSGPSSGGYSTGGGYSTKTVIDLCGQGYFHHSHASSMSVDTGGASANSHNRGNGAGTWEVVADGGENAVLRLNFHSGEVSEYTLSYEDQKTYLNGTRYFRTYNGDNAPDCQ